MVYGEEEEDMIRFALFRVDVAIDKGIRYLEDKKENDGWTDDIAIMTLNVVPPYFPNDVVDDEKVMRLYRAVVRHEPMRCRLEKMTREFMGNMEKWMNEWWWEEMENMVLYSMKARALIELGRRVVVGGDVRVKNFVIDRAKELAGGKPFEVKKVILKCLSLGSLINTYPCWCIC